MPHTLLNRIWPAISIFSSLRNLFRFHAAITAKDEEGYAGAENLQPHRSPQMQSGHRPEGAFGQGKGGQEKRRKNRIEDNRRLQTVDDDLQLRLQLPPVVDGRRWRC